MKLNDHIQDFVDSRLVIMDKDGIKDKDCKIYKFEMLKEYKDLFPELHFTEKHLMTSLPSKSVPYNFAELHCHLRLEVND